MSKQLTRNSIRVFNTSLPVSVLSFNSFSLHINSIIWRSVLRFFPIDPFNWVKRRSEVTSEEWLKGLFSDRIKVSSKLPRELETLNIPSFRGDEPFVASCPRDATFPIRRQISPWPQLPTRTPASREFARSLVLCASGSLLRYRQADHHRECTLLRPTPPSCGDRRGKTWWGRQGRESFRKGEKEGMEKGDGMEEWKSCMSFTSYFFLLESCTLSSNVIWDVQYEVASFTNWERLVIDAESSAMLSDAYFNLGQN